MTSPHFTVVGAGVAGLTLAHQLSAQGRRVTVLERSDFVGGLARTWHYGAHHFDVGPHRFHTENPRVDRFIRDVLGPDTLEIRRSSGVRMFGRFHEWPLRPSVFASLPLSLVLTGARDLILRDRRPGESFEADILNKYGRTLYEIFFRPYTRKFLFEDPAGLHRDWARAGVNRAVIDKRASVDTLVSLIRTTLLPKPVDTTFLYTADGVGRFADKLTAAIRSRGGQVLLNRTVTGLELQDGRISAVMAGSERWPTDGVAWTGPITEAAALLGLRGVDLEFLSTIFYNLEVAAPLTRPYQWTYFAGDELFSRVSAPTAFAETMAPAGTSGLCVEVTCREGDERWRQPDGLTGTVVADLVRTGVIRRAADVTGLHVEPVRNTYPIYKLNYPAELARTLRELGGCRNLLLAGRCGRFWYNNMDHSIGQVLTMAERVLRGETLSVIDEGVRNFWDSADGAGQSSGAATLQTRPATAPGGASASPSTLEPGTSRTAPPV